MSENAFYVSYAPIPGMGDHDGAESVITMRRNGRSRRCRIRTQDRRTLHEGFCRVVTPLLSSPVELHASLASGPPVHREGVSGSANLAGSLRIVSS